MRRRRRQESEAKPGDARAPWLLPWLVLGLSILTVAAVLVILGLSGRAISVPAFLVDRIENRANLALEGQASLNISGADLVVGQGFVPQIRLADVTLKTARGQRLATVADMRGAFQMGALLRGELKPAAIVVRGARLAVRRLEDGTFDIAPRVSGLSGQSRSPADILDDIDRAFALPALSALQVARIEGVAILFDDRRSGQVWTIRDGAVSLTRRDAGMAMTLGFDLYGDPALHQPGSDAPTPPGVLGRAELSLTTARDTPEAAISLRLTGISARDLAGQVPALAWLGALDAPISGALASGFDKVGNLTPLTARLDLGAGALRPTPGTKPVPFDSAHIELGYDPATFALDIGRIEVASPSLMARAAGKAWLKGMADGQPEALVGQISLSRFSANPGDLFAKTVTIGEGLADLKVDLDPFRITIGQLVLVDQGRRISAKGRIAAEPKGWSVALDVGIDSIQSDRLLALWPLRAVPKTREWLIANVAAGELYDVKGAMRLKPGAEPQLALGYRFRGAEVRFLKTLPPIIDGSGYASIDDYTYTLVAEAGRIRAPKGGDLDVAGSVVQVPDLRARPTRAAITLHSRGPIAATLAILDEAPFHFLTKAGKPTDLADGTAVLTTRLTLPLIRQLKLPDITYDVTGTLEGVRSDVLVPGRTLAADRLAVRATPEALTIGGDATLDGVPLHGRWTQPLGPEGKGKSRVEADVALTMSALETFGIALPKGSVAGTGSARVSLDLERDRPPRMVLTSNLAGLTLSIPELGWKKEPAKTGTLAVEGLLGTPPDITRLDIDAAGLQAKARLTLKPDGGLDRLDLPGLTIADWFTGDAALIGRGKGNPVGVEVTAGSVDLRRTAFGPGRGGASGAPVAIALDSLRISEEIALGPFRGTFASESGGLTGSFEGRVNGAAAIAGRMSPAENGRAAFGIEAEDAGAVLQAAGIYSSGRGGRLALTLTPDGGAGTYRGSANIRAIRVVNAPELAGLLNAISVVGLLTQLQGAGIFFSDVEGEFLLTPDAIEIRQGSAIGPSLGVSAAGLYRSADRSLDIQGVISPIYLLNGVGQIFSRQRDGLFGFNYRMTGTRDRTEVSVNPLSILTPGLFRDLFRKPPPKLSP